MAFNVTTYYNGILEPVFSQNATTLETFSVKTRHKTQFRGRTFPRTTFDQRFFSERRISRCHFCEKYVPFYWCEKNLRSP